MARRATSSADPATCGSMALEYGLILPVLVLMILGTMEVGRLIWTYTTLVRAVEASARCAAVNPAACGSASQIASRAATEAWGLAPATSVFTSQILACGMTVTATYNHSLLIPWPGGSDAEHPSNSIPLTVTACYPL
jgi:Flp pilus assembly protein TadG